MTKSEDNWVVWGFFGFILFIYLLGVVAGRAGYVPEPTQTVVSTQSGVLNYVQNGCNSGSWYRTVTIKLDGHESSYACNEFKSDIGTINIGQTCELKEFKNPRGFAIGCR